MVEHVYYFDSDNINPYHNQALCNYLFNHIPDNSLVLCLWQNNDTVLLANQQSPYNQCNLNQMELEHVYLARRDTKGKAIYNDLGCLNYAFFMYQNNYSVINQINVIYQALSQLNLPVYLDETNEIMLDGKKITDNTYLVKEEKCLHSGTIYWAMDMGKRARCLTDKTLKKNLINISEYNPCINMMEIKKKIVQSLSDKYGPVYQLSIADSLEEMSEYYHSYLYTYKTKEKYTIIVDETIEIGAVQLYVDLLKNKIVHLDVYCNDEDSNYRELIIEMFEGLVIDEVLFKERLMLIDEKYQDDLTKIYKKIKRGSYRL